MSWRPSRTRFSCNSWGRPSAGASSFAAPPERMIRPGGVPCAAMDFARRSAAPAQARIAPVAIASGVLAGKSRTAPSDSRSAAVARSNERRMSAGPGTMTPPRNRPSPESASIVSAVPALITSLCPGRAWCAAMSATHRSVPSCEGSRYPLVTPSSFASLRTNRTGTSAALHMASIAPCAPAPATFDATALSRDFALRSASFRRSACAVSTAPVTRHAVPSWTPHLMRVFPASIARTEIVPGTNMGLFVPGTIIWRGA
jgi:hypothetical protein